MHITRNKSPIITTYFLNGQALEVTDSQPYLGVITRDALRALRVKKWVGYLFFVLVVVFLFFFVVVTNGNNWINWTWLKTVPPPPPPRGDIFVLHCSHCLQRSSAFSSGREGGTSLSTRLTSHSHGSRLLSKYWPFYIHVLDSNMTFSERKVSLLKR